MHRLDLPPLTAAEQLAADEALLNRCEAGADSEILMFWEPRETFVVVGYANHVATEVNTAACAAQGIPIFRRCSGGGTVVQMPGGLNYSLILRITGTGPTRNITAANQFIMEKYRKAMAAARRSSGPQDRTRENRPRRACRARRGRASTAPIWTSPALLQARCNRA